MPACNNNNVLDGFDCPETELKKFKTRVFYKYILEVIIDVVISVASVVTDILSIGFYIQKGRWAIAIVTAIPVLLPTIIFTNVYLADETQGYCKLPKHQRRSRRTSRSRAASESDEQASTSTAITGSGVTDASKETHLEHLNQKMDFHCGTCHMLCVSCTGFCGGLLRSICYKDEKIRENGSKMVKKSVKRITKYLFGTFVLRFISLTWYAKAFMFGIRAYRDPKKYIKMPIPSEHWSYDLLVKLDFLQAALENAPQCVVQLYVLMVYSDENIIVGGLTLLFSFMDFVRVSISVQWDIHRGPVIAPSGCYSTILWKFFNMSSWIFLYIGRSAALALSIATAHSWSIAIPIVILSFHVCLFTKLFSKTKYGVAAQKLVVSVFISLFFLPEFDTTEFPIITQFYYAVVHVENLFFIVPWNGMDYPYCRTGFKWGGTFNPPGKPTPRLNDTIFQSLTTPNPIVDRTRPDCLINPTIIVIAVPALTMIGIIFRLAASKKMADFKKTIPARDDKMVMEERVANIYSKKWTSMSISALFNAFVRMLKKEVIQSAEEEKGENEAPVFIISPSFNKEFQASQNFIRGFASHSCLHNEGQIVKTKRSMSVDASGLIYRGGKLRDKKDFNGNNSFGNLLGVGEHPKRSKSQDDMNLHHHDGKNEPNLVKLEGPEGPYLTEMTWI